MEKFEPELRSDLQEVYGVDLADLFSKKRWRHLLALIDGLQPHSRYMAALLSDPEIAKEIVNHPSYAENQAADSGPSLVGYTGLNAQMAQLIDAVNANTSATISAAGGKAKRPKPIPRPQTGVDRAKADRRKIDQQSIIDEFTTS